MPDIQTRRSADLDISPRTGAIAVFGFATIFLFALAPTAPFSRELGACEAGAVRDVLAGHITLPSFEPGVFVHVPPMYWWIAAGFVRLMGMTELALRLPALLAAALTCATLYWWLAIAWSPRAGFFAAAALLFSQFFADAARQPRMDSMLALFVTGAIGLIENSISDRAGRVRLWYALASMLIFLAILTKGPLGIVLPGLTIGLFLIVQRRFKELFNPALIACFAVSLMAGVAWYVAAYRVGGDEFFRWQVETGLLKRFVPTEIGGAGFCKHPFYYFIPHVLSGFLPWSLFIPAAFALVCSSGQSVRLSQTPSRREALSFAGVWFAAILGLFSASTGKCLIYILPAFPPLAALIGMTLDYVLDEEVSWSWPRLLARIAAGVVAAAAGATVAGSIAIVGAGPLSPHASNLHESDRAFLTLFESVAKRGYFEFLIFFSLSGFACAWIVAGLFRRRFERQIAGVTIFAAASVLFWYGTLNPIRAAQTSLKGFAAKVDGIVPSGATITYVGPVDCEVAFVYSTHSMRHLDAPALVDRPPSGYLIFWQDRFDSLPIQSQQKFRVLARSAAVDSHGARFLTIRDQANGAQN
jgi:hypothetical protein